MVVGRPAQRKGLTVSTSLYALATECNAAANVAGQAFTPLSTIFCPHELTRSEYFVLIAAIYRLTSRTGYLWYLRDAFHDSDAAFMGKSKCSLT